MSAVKQHKKKKKKEKRAKAITEEIEPVQFNNVGAKKSAEPQFPVGDEFSLANGRNITADQESPDQEIWMIQVPQNFDVRQLNDQMVLLEGEQSLPQASTGSTDRHHSIASRFKEGEASACNALVPSESVAGELQGMAANGKCAGTIRILRAVDAEDHDFEVPAEPRRPKRKAMPAGLRARYQPYGTTPPVKVPSKHMKKALKTLHASS